MTSVIYASRNAESATLTDIIAAADWLNHAIISRGELETGCARLIRAGHLKKTAEGFAATDPVKLFWQKKCSKVRSTHHKTWEAVARHIGAPAWDPGLPDTKDELHVTEADYAASLREYHHNTRRPKTK